MQDVSSVEASLRGVKLTIAEAARASGRDPASVRLVAVTKTVPEETVEAAIEAGQCCFGENRVQEAKAKWSDLKARHPGLELHLIGPLQTNKVRDAVALFDVIETLDRPKLAAALADEIERTGARPRLFVQVNTGEEPQKAGVLPVDVDDFVRTCREEHRLGIDGLMCIPPLDEEPSLHFALLAKIASRLGLKELSMGMSGDYRTAIAFGATCVRIGTAIFGDRQMG